MVVPSIDSSIPNSVAYWIVCSSKAIKYAKLASLMLPWLTRFNKAIWSWWPNQLFSVALKAIPLPTSFPTTLPITTLIILRRFGLAKACKLPCSNSFVPAAFIPSLVEYPE